MPIITTFTVNCNRCLTKFEGEYDNLQDLYAALSFAGWSRSTTLTTCPKCTKAIKSNRRLMGWAGEDKKNKRGKGKHG